MIEVKSFDGAISTVILQGKDYSNVEKICRVGNMTWFAGLKKIIERGLIELTGDLPENRSTNELD